MWCIVGTQQIIKYLLTELAALGQCFGVFFYITGQKHIWEPWLYTALSVLDQGAADFLSSGQPWSSLAANGAAGVGNKPRPTHKATRRMSCPSSPSHVATLAEHGLMDSQLNKRNKTKGRCPYTVSLRSEGSVLP